MEKIQQSEYAYRQQPRKTPPNFSMKGNLRKPFHASLLGFFRLEQLTPFPPDVEDRVQMLHSQGLLVLGGQDANRLYGTLDLYPIERPLREAGQVLAGDAHFISRQCLDEVGPEFSSRAWGEIRVRQSDVNT